MNDFEGQVVLVTGGSRGMGAAMVRAFAQRGADVVIASRKAEACRELADAVREEHGVHALPIECNVSDWSHCDALVERSYAEFGRVDVLINNAGLSPLYPSLNDVTEALFDKVIAVNLRGPFRLGAAVGTRMAARDGGCIINVGSIEAIRPHPGALPYAAAKAALHVLTEGFARAFAPRVRVNTIQPGAFATDISAHWSDEMRAEIDQSVALGRSGEPDEVVGAALYFASPAARYTTGALLRVDGGWR